MNIIIAHNYYQQPGGEDQVFASEERLLRAYGHRVTCFTAHNDAIDGMGRLALVGATAWNVRTAAALEAQARDERADLVHFHNIFPLISPAAYAAARRAGCAVVQTLHNFRLLCPKAILFRDGRACESCLGRSIAWPAVVHGCYRGSRSASALVALTTAVHHALKTYSRGVDLYVALSEFARRTLVRGGMRAESIVVKPNFVAPDPGAGDGGGGYALFVGRLAEGKGVETLLAAWPRLERPILLKIVGDGELAHRVREAAGRGPWIEWLGHRPWPEMLDLLGQAAFLVFPSECYETFGRVAIEAFAKATPVLASDHGAMAELIEPGRTGACFRVGDPDDLARQADRLLSDPETLSRMRRQARQEFEARYSEARNHDLLMDIYRQALENAGRRHTGRT